jgi:hypothetical protein
MRFGFVFPAGCGVTSAVWGRSCRSEATFMRVQLAILCTELLGVTAIGFAYMLPTITIDYALGG